MRKTRQFQVDDDKPWTVFEVIPRPSFPVASAFRSGWLAFERGDEVRRLAPIPPDWENASESALAQMLERATPGTNSPL